MSSAPPPSKPASTCAHVFFQTSLTKAVPTYCDECRSLCFILQNLRRCSFCDMYLHGDCFVRRVARTPVSPATVPSGSTSANNNVAPMIARPTAAASFATPPTEATTTAQPTVSGTTMSLVAAMTESPASPAFHSPTDGQQIQHATHIHSPVVCKSATLGSTCDICSNMIVSFGMLSSRNVDSFGGGDGTYFMCTDCDFRAHAKCFMEQYRQQQASVASSSPATKPPKTLTVHDFLSEDEYLRNVKEQKQQHEQTKDKVISGTLDVMRALDSRNKHKWGDYTLNPVTLYRVQKRQAQLYIALCAELPSATLVPKSELARLVDVLRFATAVYGAAYEHGYFASVVSNLFLQVARKNLVNAKPETNNEAVANILCMPRANILASYWGADMGEPSFCVIGDEAAGRVVLAFRGSLTEADFLTDACGTLGDFAVGGAVAGGAKAHVGIVATIEKVFDPSNKLYIIPKLVEIMRARPASTKLVVTGHSLGGGLTILFCAKALATDALCIRDERTNAVLRTTRDMLQGVAFAPPPVLTKPCADMFDANLVSVVAGKDVVTRLQIPSVDRMGAHLMAANSRVARTTRLADESSKDLPVKKPVLHEAEGAEVPSDASADWDTVPEASQIMREDDAIATAVDTQEECFLAGRVVFTSDPTNRNTAAHFIPRESPLLHTIWVSQYMIPNHTMDNYGQALQNAAASAP